MVFKDGCLEATTVQQLRANWEQLRCEPGGRRNVWTAEVDRIVYLVDESALPADENVVTRRSINGWTRSERRRLQTFREDVEDFVDFLVRKAEEEHLQQRPAAVTNDCICNESRNAEESEEEDTANDENDEEGDDASEDSHQDRGLSLSDKVRSLLVRGDHEDANGDSQEGTKESHRAHDDEESEAFESQGDDNLNDEENLISEEEDEFPEKEKESQSLDREDCLCGESHNAEQVVQKKNHDSDEGNNNVDEAEQKDSQAPQQSDDVDDLLGQARCSVRDKDQKVNPSLDLVENSVLSIHEEEESRSFKDTVTMRPEPADLADYTGRNEEETLATAPEQEHEIPVETLEPPATLSNIDSCEEKDRSESGSSRQGLHVPVRGLFCRMMRKLRRFLCCASQSA
jgi:hypothetical protein